MKKKGLENMTQWLSNETKIGMTISQLLSLIVTVAMVVGFWANFTIKIAAIEQKNVELEARINNTENVLETVRKENRDDHQKVNEKIDKVLLLLTTK